MTTLSLPRMRSPRPIAAPGTRMRTLVPPAVGLAAAVVVGAGAGISSYWGDEGASVMSAERPWSSLALELSDIDSVHGLYYAFLHVWIGLLHPVLGTAAAGEWATRFPSVVAAGLAVWGIVVLGRSLFDLRVGVVAGGILAVLPEFTRIGIETRSYAMACALGVWLTVLLVRVAVRGTRRAGWVLYGAGAVVAVALFEFLALLLLVHLVLLAALRVPRISWRRWLLSLAAATPAVGGFLLLSFAERHQIAFLRGHDYGTVQDVLVGQWFRTDLLAAIVWTLVLAGIVLGRKRMRSQRRRILPLVVWALGPTAILVAVNVGIMPIYNERYLSPSLPGVALLAALGATGLVRLARGRRRILIAAALTGALVVVATPSYLAQRRPFSKDGGADLRQAADTLHRLASPGDAVVFTRDVSNSQRPQMETHLYPQDFAGLDDVALDVPYTSRAAIWDAELPVSDLGPRLADHPVVWADEVSGHQASDLSALESMGYRITRTVKIRRTPSPSRSVLYRLEKEPS